MGFEVNNNNNYLKGSFNYSLTNPQGKPEKLQPNELISEENANRWNELGYEIWNSDPKLQLYKTLGLEFNTQTPSSQITNDENVDTSPEATLARIERQGYMDRIVANLVYPELQDGGEKFLEDMDYIPDILAA